MKLDASSLIFYEPYTIWYQPWWYRWWFKGIIVLVAVAFLVVVIRWLLAGRKQLTPWQQATRELDALQPEHFLKEDGSKEFYSRLTATVKQYVLARFGLDATGMTDTEFVDVIKSSPQFPKKLHGAVDNIYEGVVMIKFADGQAQQSAMLEARAAAYQIIKQTIPSGKHPDKRRGA